MLGHLPDDLLRYLLHEWLNTRPELRSLDTACCNHELRRSYVQALRGVTISWPGGEWHVPSKKLQKWMKKRGVGFSNVVIDKGFTTSSIWSKGLCVPEKITSILLKDDDEAALAPFLLRCSALEVLTTSFHFSDIPLWIRVPAPWKLRKLSISGLFFPGSLVSFVTSFENLRDLTIEPRAKFSTVVDILHHLPKLMRLQLEFRLALSDVNANLTAEDMDDLPPPCKWHQCPALTHIVHLDVTAPTTTILLYLLHRCSQLQSLIASYSGEDMEEQECAFLELGLAQSLCTLTRLDLSGFDFSPSTNYHPASLIDEMELNSALRKLEVRDLILWPSNLLFQALCRSQRIQFVQVKDTDVTNVSAIQSSYRLLNSLPLSSVIFFGFDCASVEDTNGTLPVDEGALCPILSELTDEVHEVVLDNVPMGLFDSDEHMFLVVLKGMKRLYLIADHGYDIPIAPLSLNAMHFVLFCCPNLTDLTLGYVDLSDKEFVLIMQRFCETANAIWFENISDMTLTSIVHSDWENLGELLSQREYPLQLTLYNVSYIDLDALEVAVNALSKNCRIDFRYSYEQDEEYEEKAKAIGQRYVEWLKVSECGDEMV